MEKQKKIIIYHPTGNANTRGAVNGFYKVGILHSFHTCIACFKGTLFYKLAIGPLKEFRRREFCSFLRSCTHTYPVKELFRLMASKLNQRQWITHETGKFCIDKVYHNLDKKVSKYLVEKASAINAIYAYEDEALETFRMAKELHKVCIYDLPIGYWRSMHELLGQERVRNPKWADTLGGFNDSQNKLKRKDEELALADKIYVASTFTKRTLDKYPGKLADIEVIPYGFPHVNTNRAYVSFVNRKIKILFVGSLSQRKGLSYLFEAVNGLDKNIELTVVGKGAIDQCEALKRMLKQVNYIPSLSHEKILELMSKHDLFVFPSLFEGFGLVITEAMSQGTPVITTDRTCGSDIITHGKDGWIVKAGTAAPIRELIQTFIANPEMLANAGKEAMKTAAQRPWSVYEKELAESVKKFLDAKLSESK